MINITERAVTGIEEILIAEEVAPGEAIKLIPTQEGGIGVTIGSPSAGDEVVQRGDAPLLIVDGRIAPVLDGAVLDVSNEDGAAGSPRFTLTPRAD